ncbi:MAG: hypothetical protein WCI12_11640 [Actinomycetes bacterium]
MAMEGMDVGVAQTKVSQLHATQSDFDAVLAKIETIASEQGWWIGTDFNNFVSQWHGAKSALHGQFQGFLTELTTALNNEIRQQTEASNS